MLNVKLRNIWVVTKREYIERVRTKAFLIMTILTPALMAMNVFLPSMFIGAKTGGSRHIVVVASRAELASAVKARLERTAADAPKSQGDRIVDIKYAVETSTDTSDANRKALQGQ